MCLTRVLQLERFWMQPALSLVILAGMALKEIIRLARINQSYLIPVAFLIISARLVRMGMIYCDTILLSGFTTFSSGVRFVRGYQ